MSPLIGKSSRPRFANARVGEQRRRHVNAADEFGAVGTRGYLGTAQDQRGADQIVKQKFPKKHPTGPTEGSSSDLLTWLFTTFDLDQLFGARSQSHTSGLSPTTTLLAATHLKAFFYSRTQILLASLTPHSIPSHCTGTPDDCAWLATFFCSSRGAFPDAVTAVTVLHNARDIPNIFKIL